MKFPTKETKSVLKRKATGRRVLVIGTNDMLLGGAQRLVIDQLRSIDRSIYDIHLVVLMEFSDKKTFLDSVPEDVIVHHLHFSGLRDIRKWWKLLLLLRQLRPNVVVASLFFSNTVFTALKPFVGYEVIAAEHNTVNKKPFWQRGIDRLLFPLVSTVIAASPAVVEFVSESEGIDRKHFTVIYNGVDTDAIQKSQALYGPKRSDLRKANGIPEGAKVIINVGWLIEQKNPHLMIESFAKLYPSHPLLYLVMVGGGKYTEEMTLLASTLGVADRVLLLGEQNNVHQFYAIADLYLLTSRHEGFCIAAMEALAFGLPLISTRVAGVSEYLEDGTNGFFTEPNSSSVAEKIEQVLSLTKVEREAFAVAGKSTASRYSVSRYAVAFTELIERTGAKRNYDTTHA